MSLTGARVLFNRLLKHKVKHVFGYPGGAILPVLNEFHNQNKIKYVLSRTELGGGFMAEGYAKITKQPGVVMVTSGPGAINVMTSLHNALSDGTPLLALSGQVSTKVIGTDAFQEADVISISRPCTKFNSQIRSTGLINFEVDSAFEFMKSKRPGPVLLDLPKDVMSNKYEKDISTWVEQKYDYTKYYIAINDLIREVERAKRPVILAGQGVLQGNAHKLLRRFADFYNIPVTTTLMGLGAFDEKNYLSLKMLGMHGSYYANMAVQNSDLLINFGSRFDDRIIGDKDKFAPNAYIIHVDIEERNMLKTIVANRRIVDDCKNVLREINNKINMEEYYPYRNAEWLSQINQWKKIDFSYPKKKQLQGRKVIDSLNNMIQQREGKYTIVADVGAHQMWAAQFIDYNYPKVKFITSGGLGSMGFALPASIGAKIGSNKDTVICICGDGGFQMTMIELLTAIENKVNIKVLIINNSYQLMVKMWQDKFYNGNFIGTKMNNPPFHEVCKKMGCKTMVIKSNTNLNKKLEEFMNYNDGPIVANVLTDENETVLPMVAPGKPIDDMILEDSKEKMKGEVPS